MRTDKRTCPFFSLMLVLLGVGTAHADGPPAPPPDRFRQRNLARLHAERGTRPGFEAAAKILEGLVHRAPDSLIDRLNLARVLLWSGAAPKRIAPHLAAVRRLEGAPPSEATLYLEGLLAKRRGDDATAAARFAAVVARAPGLLQARYQRAFAEERRGRLVAAESAYAALTVRAPTFRAAWYRLAMVRGRLRQPTAMRAALARFRALPDKKQPDTVRCALTRIALRTPRRRDAEPPAPKMAWEDRTEALLGKQAPVPPEDAIFDVVALAAKTGAARRLAIVGPGGLRIIERAGAGGRFTQTRRVLTGALLHTVISADLDNDGHQDLFTLGSFHMQPVYGGEGGAFEPGQRLATKQPTLSKSARAVDLDHDGDLDIVFVRVLPVVASKPMPKPQFRLAVLQNRGDRTFRPIAPAPFADVHLAVGAQGLDFHDLDLGNDVDLVAPGQGADAHALLNLRDGSFRRAPLPGLGGYRYVLSEDLTGDGVPDVVAFGGRADVAWAASRGRPPQGGVRFGPAQRISSERVYAGVLMDGDLDGDLDLVLGTASGLVFVRNRAGEELVPEEGRVTLADDAGVASLRVADLEGDPAPELIVITTHATLRILAPRPTPRYAAWALRPIGRRDNRDAIGTVVEQLGGRLYQSRMVKRAGPLVFGLGAVDRARLDGVRLRWPLGIRQSVPRDRLKLGADGVAAVTEKAGVVASCPFLYARGPDGWRFITDVVGIAPLAEWMPPGVEPALDPEEFVRIPGDALRVENGRVRIAITEELRETTYLDRVELVAVDHPASSMVYTDESTRQGAYDPLRLFVIPRQGLEPPAACRLPGGRDARALVAARDGRYVHPYRPVAPQLFGYGPPHALDLVTAAPARLLLLTGRIAWYTSNVPFALSQHGAGFAPLALWRVGAEGPRPLVEDLGFPAGMDRTMVVELPGGPLPAGAALRLTGQHWFFWDRIAFACEAARVTLPDEDGVAPLPGGGTLAFRTLAPRRALLGFHGFGLATGDLDRHEQRYLYEGAQPDDTYPPARGLATRYGDVLPLVELPDDRVAVLVAGDGVEIWLDAPPPLEPGHARTYFLRVTGWAKEGSFHNRTGQQIAPLPLRAMRSYPPPAAAARTDAAYRRYLRAYQTRRVGR